MPSLLHYRFVEASSSIMRHSEALPLHLGYTSIHLWLVDFETQRLASLDSVALAWQRQYERSHLGLRSFSTTPTCQMELKNPWASSERMTSAIFSPGAQLSASTALVHERLEEWLGMTYCVSCQKGQLL